ncbi:MAG: hypothetical protein J0M26_27235 [Planctomycetes bacterium]|jgi:hypothetical protein|nr:hypothetical protein [Planctomycetota bacterium]
MSNQSFYQASLLREEDSPRQSRVTVSAPDDPELKVFEEAVRSSVFIWAAP